jgi:hypothetical protein
VKHWHINLFSTFQFPPKSLPYKADMCQKRQTMIQ